MYVITCPHCNRHIKINREIREAKVKCRYCRQVFVGSTRQADEARPATRPTSPTSAAPAPTKNIPASRLRHHSHIRAPKIPKSKSTVPIIVTILGVVAIIIGLIVFVYRYKHPPAPTTQPAPSKLTRTVRGGASARPRASRAGPAKPATAHPQEHDTLETIEAAEIKLPFPVDPKIAVTRFRQLPTQPHESPLFVGKFQNEHDHAMEWVQIDLIITNAEGAMIRVFSQRYKHIPAGYEGRFSIRLNFQMEEGMRVTSRTAQGQPAAKNTTGWDLRSSFRMNIAGNVLQIHGRLRNEKDSALDDAVVWCDFFTSDGQYVASKAGLLQPNGKYLARATPASYKIEFDTSDTDFVPETIRIALPRIVGTTSR